MLLKNIEKRPKREVQNFRSKGKKKDQAEVQSRRKSQRNTNAFTCETFMDAQGKVQNSPLKEFNYSLAATSNKKIPENANRKYAAAHRNPYYMEIHGDKIGQIFDGGDWAPQNDTRNATTEQPLIAMAYGKSYVSLKFIRDLAWDEVNWYPLSRKEDPPVIIHGFDAAKNEEAEELKEMHFVGLTLDAEKGPDLGGTRSPRAQSNENSIQEDRGALEEEATQQTQGSLRIEEEDEDKPTQQTQESLRIEEEDKPTDRIPIFVPVRHSLGRLAFLRLNDNGLKYWSPYETKRLAQLSKIKSLFAPIWLELFPIPDAEYVAGFRPRYTIANLGFPLVVVPGERALASLKCKSNTEVHEVLKDMIDVINQEQGQGAMQLELKLKSEIFPPNNSSAPEYVQTGDNPFGLYSTYVKVDNQDTYMQSLQVPTRYSAQPKVDSARPRSSSQHQKDLETFKKTHKGADESKFSSQQKDGQLKLRNAVGKRSGIRAPGNIMGMSASDCAVVCLDWQYLNKAQEDLSHPMRLSNGLYMAEWLHLSAFSWGGLLDVPKVGQDNSPQHESSDIPTNLVLGTSETNSQMTRFEKAWQSLVRDETILREDDDFNPTLHVVRNPQGQHVIWDKSEIIDQITNTCRYTREKDAMTTAEREMATKFSFIAYSVHYEIEFPAGCYLLGLGRHESLKTVFYPFLRPFYHMLEAELDSALYNRMKERLADDISLGLVPKAEKKNATKEKEPLITGFQHMNIHPSTLVTSLGQNIYPQGGPSQNIWAYSNSGQSQNLLDQDLQGQNRSGYLQNGQNKHLGINPFTTSNVNGNIGNQPYYYSGRI